MDDEAELLQAARDELETDTTGAAWGEQLARTLLAEAGFGEVTVYEAPGDPLNAVFVTSRPEA